MTLTVDTHRLQYYARGNKENQIMGFEHHVCCAYRSGSGDDWEFLDFASAPSSIRGDEEETEEEEEEKTKSCSVDLEIELGNLIDANYFACPSPPPPPVEICDSADLSPLGSGVQNRADPQFDDTTVADWHEKISMTSAPQFDDTTVAFCLEADEIASRTIDEKGSGTEDQKSFTTLDVAAENNHSLSALSSPAAGRMGSGVIEGLCIVRPLVVTELALFRMVDSPACFNSWRAGKTEEFSEGLKAVAVEEFNKSISSPNTPKVVCSSSSVEGKCKGRLNFLNCLKVWRKNVGMLPSLGMAAAVMGLLILGRKIYRGKSKNRNQGLIRFQVYGENKRISHLMNQAARLNEALSATKGGVSVVRAQISFGGYCDSP